MKKALKCCVIAFSIASLHADVGSSSKQDPKISETHGVFLSSPNYCIDTHFTALILQPTSSNLHYAAEADPLPVVTPNWKIHEIHPDYHFGFDLGLSGVFHKTNSNLIFNWEHFRSSDSASKTVSLQDMVGPFFTIGPDAAPYTKAKGKVHFHFEEADVDYGVFINFGDRLQTNLFAGVSYAYIKETMTSKFSNVDGTQTRSIKVPSRFSGAGPKAGLLFTYKIVKGFHLTGDAAVSVLVGSLKNHTTYKSTTPLLEPLGVTPPNKQSTKTANRTQVVPGLEGKLGLCYNYEFCDHYRVNLELGYQAQIYINALQSTDMGSEVPLNSVEPVTVGVYARTFQRTLSNFALAGPYVTLNFGF